MDQKDVYKIGNATLDHVYFKCLRKIYWFDRRRVLYSILNEL